MKAKLFHNSPGCCDSRYCIDKKVHVAVGYSITAGPCDGSCEPKEVELKDDCRIEAMISRFLRTGQSCSWDDEG